jgi:hypothetical protein
MQLKFNHSYFRPWGFPYGRKTAFVGAGCIADAVKRLQDSDYSKICQII